MSNYGFESDPSATKVVSILGLPSIDLPKKCVERECEVLNSSPQELAASAGVILESAQEPEQLSLLPRVNPTYTRGDRELIQKIVLERVCEGCVQCNGIRSEE
jgi:hypothetical protein